MNFNVLSAAFFQLAYFSTYNRPMYAHLIPFALSLDNFFNGICEASRRSILSIIHHRTTSVVISNLNRPSFPEGFFI